MKNKIILLVLIVVGLFVFSVARDYITKVVVTVTASRITGAPVRIGGFSMSLMRQSVNISNFKMYNPVNKGFKREIMIDIPAIRVSYDVAALLRGKLHLKFIEFELKEMDLIKNKEGKLNVDSLKIVEGDSKAPVKEGHKPSKPMAMQIDTIELGIGKIVSKDYSVSGEPLIKVYDVNIKKTYKNITSAQQLIVLIITEPLKSAGIRSAAIYGVSMLTGVAALPVAAAFTLGGKDYSESVFDASWDKTYDACFKAMQASGDVKEQDKNAGVIKASVKGADVTLKLKSQEQNKTQVIISARKYLLPQPELAAGIMYRISDELK